MHAAMRPKWRYRYTSPPRRCCAHAPTILHFNLEAFLSIMAPSTAADAVGRNGTLPSYYSNPFHKSHVGYCPKHPFTFSLFVFRYAPVVPFLICTTSALALVLNIIVGRKYIDAYIVDLICCVNRIAFWRSNSTGQMD